MTVVSNLPVSDHQEGDREVILKIFSSIGRCRFLEEKHFDACTALSGSGPAFACIFLEAMADGGVMMGLPRAEALELAAQSEFALRYLELLILIRLVNQHCKVLPGWFSKPMHTPLKSRTPLQVRAILDP